jgi:hypothetical protein
MNKKLSLSRETLLSLGEAPMSHVVGAYPLTESPRRCPNSDFCSDPCPPPESGRRPCPQP